MVKQEAQTKNLLATLGWVLYKALLVGAGGVIMAYALESMLIPNDIIDGGITGISMLLNAITPVSLSIYLVLLNLPFLYLGYKQIGRSFAFSMAWGILVLAVATNFMHHVPVLTDDKLLAIVFGGVLLGAGIGLAMRGGGCLDGSESLAILIEKKTPFTVGNIILVINVFIFSVAAFVFGIESALSSMLTFYIASKTIDIVVRGFDDMKSMYIFSESHAEIAEAISNRLGRGVTTLNGEGQHSGKEQKIIFVVFSRLEEAKIKDVIKEIDPHAFEIINDLAEVRGGRFKKKDIH